LELPDSAFWKEQNYDGRRKFVVLEEKDSVDIYCERFHAVFGVAKLERF